MTSTITYKGDLECELVHNASHTSIFTDAPVDNYGKGSTFSPTDLVCAAAAACMMSIMGIAANRHNLDLKNTKIDVQKIMASDPRRISEMKIEIYFNANNFTDADKKILEHMAMHCPVLESLHPSIKKEINFHW
jgi:putative redox protein